VVSREEFGWCHSLGFDGWESRESRRNIWCDLVIESKTTEYPALIWDVRPECGTCEVVAKRVMLRSGYRERMYSLSVVVTGSAGDLNKYPSGSLRH